MSELGPSEPPQQGLHSRLRGCEQTWRLGEAVEGVEQSAEEKPWTGEHAQMNRGGTFLSAARQPLAAHPMC